LRLPPAARHGDNRNRNEAPAARTRVLSMSISGVLRTPRLPPSAGVPLGRLDVSDTAAVSQ